MQLYTGTSGFAYKEWKGSFYPEDLSSDAMLNFYASQFPAVEINNSFYRIPSEKVLRQWREQVSAQFRFVLKASQKITHFGRLKEETRDALAYFLRSASVLEQQLGPILFQLPPNMKLDLRRLQLFLEMVPSDIRVAFEFRNASWFTEAVYETLHEKRAALCVADTEEEQTPRLPTADWGYLRLRRVAYEPADIDEWAKWLVQQPWSESYVFFKHEDAGTGPRLAHAFEEAFRRQQLPQGPPSAS